MESLLQDNRNTILRTKEFTVIDLLVHDFLKFTEKVCPGMTADLTKCKALCERINSVPCIAAWTSRPEFMEGAENFTPDVNLYVYGLNVKSE